MQYYENFHKDDSEQTPKKQTPSPALREGNKMASLSLFMGAVAIYTVMFSPVPISPDYPFFAAPIIFGVGAITGSILSRNKTTMKKAAIWGFILGIVSVTLGLMAYFSLVFLMAIIKDPAYAPMVNEILDQLARPVS